MTDHAVVTFSISHPPQHCTTPHNTLQQHNITSNNADTITADERSRLLKVFEGYKNVKTVPPSSSTSSQPHPHPLSILMGSIGHAHVQVRQTDLGSIPDPSQKWHLDETEKLTFLSRNFLKLAWKEGRNNHLLLYCL